MQISGGISITGGVSLTPPPGPDPWSFQGTQYGYLSSGSSGYGPRSDQIQRFSFSSDTDSVSVGNLDVETRWGCGIGNATDGHDIGESPIGGLAGLKIKKYPFATSVTSTDVGSLVTGIYFTTSSGTEDKGYVTSGTNSSTGIGYYQSWTYASGGNAVSVNSANQATREGAGQTSTTHGYVSGGSNGTSLLNNIQKFAFATEQNMTDVGNLTQNVVFNSGMSSDTHGYNAGGSSYPPYTPTETNRIEKFPFASDTNSTSLGSLSFTKRSIGGASSTTDGYLAGGTDGSNNHKTTIARWSFASDSQQSNTASLVSTNETSQFSVSNN